MYLNVTINDRVKVTCAPVSISEMRTIYKETSAKYGLLVVLGTQQVERIIDEGDIQETRIISEGDSQTTRVTNEGSTQVARVIAEGDIQEARASAEADRAETEADRATTQADEIKSIAVVNPVTSIPLLPNNVPGVPTVSYDPITGLFTYGIPIGKTGEPAQVITPTGSVTVAELNSLTSDPIIGAGYWMLDTGTVTYGDPDVIVTEINSVLIWLSDGYFFNLGPLTAGQSWDQIGGVSIEGYVPTIGDNLARFGTSYTKVEQDIIDNAQDDLITVNTTKISYTDSALVAQHTIDISSNASAASNAQSTADGAVSVNTTQQTAIDLNTAKTGITNAESEAIELNTLKVGITTGQASDIISNNAKISYTDSALVAQHTIDISSNASAASNAQSTADGAVSVNTTQQTAIDLNTAKTGITSTQADDIVANNSKVGITTTQRDDIISNNAKIGVTNEVNSAPTGGGNVISNMFWLTQSEYDALTPVANTFYVIVG